MHNHPYPSTCTGFSIKKKLFVKGLPTILLFGVVGTIAVASLISLGSWVMLDLIDLGRPDLRLSDSLALGAIFSSTDSIATLELINQVGGCYWDEGQ